MKEMASFNKNHIIECSNELILSTGKQIMAYQLIELYMSKINARDPENRIVRFTKTELEKIIGTSDIKSTTVKNAIADLMNLFSIMNEHGEWVMISLFDFASNIEIQNGESVITLKASEAGIRYFFNLDTIGYIRYRLGNIIGLKGVYSLQLYKYFLRNSRGKKNYEWAVTISDLRDLLNYSKNGENKYFMKDVIRKSCQEINSVTDVSVEYRTIKDGRALSKIVFKVINKSIDEIEKEANRLLGDIEKKSTLELAETISNILSQENSKKITTEEAAKIIEASDRKGLTSLQLMEIIAYVNKKQDIKNVVGYTISIISNGYFEPKAHINTPTTLSGPKDGQFEEAVEKLYKMNGWT